MAVSSPRAAGVAVRIRLAGRQDRANAATSSHPNHHVLVRKLCLFKLISRYPKNDIKPGYYSLLCCLEATEGLASLRIMETNLGSRSASHRKGAISTLCQHRLSSTVHLRMNQSMGYRRSSLGSDRCQPLSSKSPRPDASGPDPL
jgi:hypothetical protein